MRKNLSLSLASATALALMLPASAASAHRIGPGNAVSWGKAGVTLEEYWIDAATCGHRAAAVDLTGTAPAEALVVASRRIDNWSDSESIQRALRLAAPEVQWDRAARILQGELEKCLTERGYVKFQLTRAQAHRLKKLEAGSLERRAYLHSLASDPKVLEAQAMRGS